jgi:hypothetical protein
MRGGSCELGALPSTGTSQPMMPGTMANHISDSDNDNDTQPEDIGDENKQGGVTKWKGVRQGKGTRKVGKASDSKERFSFPASLTGALFITLPMHTIHPFHASASCYAFIIDTVSSFAITISRWSALWNDELAKEQCSRATATVCMRICACIQDHRAKRMHLSRIERAMHRWCGASGLQASPRRSGGSEGAHHSLLL